MLTFGVVLFLIFRSLLPGVPHPGAFLAMASMRRPQPSN